MTQTWNRLVTLALGCMSLICNAWAETAPAAKTPPFNFAVDPATLGTSYVDVSGGRNVKDIKKLAIINFNVEFTTYREASNSRSTSSWAQNSATGTETRTTTTRSEYKSRQLPLPSQQALQQLVDKAHADVEGQLKGMGIEIVPYETIRAMPEYANFKSAMHESPWVTETKDSNSIFMAPTGMPLYMDNLERANFLQGISGMVNNTPFQEMKVIFALKDTALLSVNMVVDFATVQAEKGFLSSLSSKVNADMVHHVHARNSSFRFMGYGQPRSVVVSLDKHVVSDKAFWREVEETKSEKKEGFGALLGAFNTKDEREYIFDMDMYYAKTQDMILATQRMFISELSKLR